MKRLTIFLFGILLSTLAMAEEECSLDLQYDIQVSSQALKVSRDNQELYQILQGGQLAVTGEPVKLSANQAALAEEYAGEVAVMVLQWVELVPQALEVARVAVTGAFTAAFGEDSAPVTTSAKALALAGETFERSVSVEDGVYSISMTEFNNIEDTLEEELSEEIEDAIMSSLGSVFVEVGKAMMSTDGSFEEQMTAFGERMDRMGQELDIMGESLEDTADQLCSGMKRVQQLEQRVEKEIPELADYTLFES